MINIDVINKCDAQEKLDWERFSVRFEENEGFKPCRGDSMHKRLFQYFTAGAHEEFLGRLNTDTKREAL